MKCPVDETTLQITDRSGIEIDWCPTCRGVWLDRGELDKVIDRTAAASRPAEGPRYGDDDDDDDDYRRRSAHGPDGGRRRKREGFLGDLFDF